MHVWIPIWALALFSCGVLAEDLQWPLKVSTPPPTSQGYGEFGDVSKAKYHTGWDIGVASGTSVFPVADGDVVLIQLLSAQSDHGFGNSVVIAHASASGGGTFYSQYSHLSSIDTTLVDDCMPKRSPTDVTLSCAPGVRRTTRDALGQSGRSGFGIQEYPDYGEHLHLEIKSFGTLCTKDGTGTVCGYSVDKPWTLGYRDPIAEIVGARPFPKAINLKLVGTSISLRYTPDGGANRPIDSLDSSASDPPLRGGAWVSGYPPCEGEGWIQVRRTDFPDCAGAAGAQRCFRDAKDPYLKSPSTYLGLLPGAWICAKFLLPTAATSSRDAVTAGVLYTGGSTSEQGVGTRGLSIELADRDGLFRIYEFPRLGPATVTELWDLIFLDLLSQAPPYAAFGDNNRELAARLVTQYGSGCGAFSTPTDKAACVVASIAKSREARLGGGRYDEGQRCVTWRDVPTECNPY